MTARCALYFNIENINYLKYININNCMWIERSDFKRDFIISLKALNHQVLVLNGARQVGKTSFVINALEHDHLKTWSKLYVNFMYPTQFRTLGKDWMGKDFFGRSSVGDEFLRNLESHLGKSIDKLESPAVVFVDEVDRHPIVMEAVQALAERSPKLKFIFTGSNLENIRVENAATGRKRYFDLYPIRFFEFLLAANETACLSVLEEAITEQKSITEFFHKKINSRLWSYLRIGGLPRIVDAYLDPRDGEPTLPEIIKDLAFSIEENVKSVLGKQSSLYEYEDILRTIARLSMNTFKLSRLQVNHTSRAEAKRLLLKTVGARVAHKIRLFQENADAQDLSKYILFDTGIINYLLNGSDILSTIITDQNKGILLETFVGTQIIAGLLAREDLFYWKSGNIAELEFVLRSPAMCGIDVKASASSKAKSLDSFALFEKSAQIVIKVTDQPLIKINHNHIAKLPNHKGTKRITLLEIPHYLAGEIPKLCEKIRCA